MVLIDVLIVLVLKFGEKLSDEKRRMVGSSPKNLLFVFLVDDLPLSDRQPGFVVRISLCLPVFFYIFGIKGDVRLTNWFKDIIGILLSVHEKTFIFYCSKHYLIES